jgi:hypothetical protein
MPGRDRTGPEGHGPRTGLRMGPCGEKEKSEKTVVGWGRRAWRGRLHRGRGGRGPWGFRWRVREEETPE